MALTSKQKREMKNLANALIDLYLESGEDIHIEEAELKTSWRFDKAKKAVVIVCVLDENNDVVKEIPATKATGRPARPATVSESAQVCQCCKRPY